jgi:hypothetical protein
MTPDLLDDLRRADPVDRDALVVPEALRARVRAASGPRTRRTRRLVPAALLAAAVVAGALVLVLARGEAPDLAARAYAATSAKGIVHYRVDHDGYVNGRLSTQQSTETWTRGDVTHTLHFERIPPSSPPRLTLDVRESGRRTRTWSASQDRFFTSTRRKGVRRTASPIPDGNPLVAFRRAYRAGQLDDLGGGRFAVRLGQGFAGMSLVYEVDPATALPRKLVLRQAIPAIPGLRPTALHGITVFRFTAYERLPVTAGTRAKLRLLPHAAPEDVGSARSLFATLRTGAAPAAAEARQIARIAGSTASLRLDLGSARTLRAGRLWLVAGPDDVCLVRKGGGGFGMGCVALVATARRGISSGLKGATIVAVPDGVRHAEVRLPGGRWSRRPVVDGLVRLTGLRSVWRLVR